MAESTDGGDGIMMKTEGRGTAAAVITAVVHCACPAVFLLVLYRKIERSVQTYLHGTST